MKEKNKRTIAWFIGFFLICSAIAYLNQKVVPSILILISGIIILPPINRRIKAKISDKNSSSRYELVRNIIAIISILIFAINISESNDTSVIKNNQTIDVSTVESDTIETTETNGTYTGQRSNGKKEGKGRFEWIDGSIYEGEFHEDKFHGQGKLTIPDKGVYEGEFKNGKKNGQGKYLFVNGDVYDGNWVDDKMSGKGTYRFANGDTYIGEFLDNQFNGEGTYTSGNNKYIGTWSNNEYKK